MSEDEFETPPSSPVKAAVQTAKEPKSVSKTGSKLITRKIQYLQERLDDLVECSLSPKSSFFVSEWSGAQLESAELDKDAHPDENVSVLFERALAVRAALTSKFQNVSGMYIGKTGNIAERFTTHIKRKSQPNEMIVMVGIALYTVDDVPECDRERYHMTPNNLALHYEEMLTNKMKEEGIKMATQETGGGGRAMASATKSTALYVLFSVS